MGLARQEEEKNFESEEHEIVDLAPFMAEFDDQRQNPPGKDRYISACYAAVLGRLESDDVFQRLFKDVVASRDHVTPSHLVNLTLRAIQYLELYEFRRQTYPGDFATAERWDEELGVITSQPEMRTLLRDLLASKDTTTTIYQRYAGLKSVLNLALPNRDLIVADFGCGGNLGLPGLELGVDFEAVADETPGRAVAESLLVPSRIVRGLAVDKEDPRDPQAIKWRHACSFYPSELHKMGDLLDLEKRVNDGSTIGFLQGDLLELEVNHKNGTLPRDAFDAVFISTLLYQMNPEQQEKVLLSARKSAKVDGFVVAQDFARINPNEPRSLSFGESWFRDPFSYRTFIAGADTNWEMREFLQWQNGRCTRVRPGDNFDEVLKNIK